MDPPPPLPSRSAEAKNKVSLASPDGREDEKFLLGGLGAVMGDQLIYIRVPTTDEADFRFRFRPQS
ncbi:hypothetical protein TMatcc_002286 [Talaromyces marneffei ATCC 18224]